MYQINVCPRENGCLFLKQFVYSLILCFADLLFRHMGRILKTYFSCDKIDASFPIYPNELWSWTWVNYLMARSWFHVWKYSIGSMFAKAWLKNTKLSVWKTVDHFIGLTVLQHWNTNLNLSRVLKLRPQMIPTYSKCACQILLVGWEKSSTITIAVCIKHLHAQHK